MGILHEDMVVISEGANSGDPTVVSVNCPDKTGLGCDLCRIILLFGLSISRAGMWVLPSFIIIVVVIFFYGIIGDFIELLEIVFSL